MDARPPLIAITMGDPEGIGAEVVVKALGDHAFLASCGAGFHIYGESGTMRGAANAAGLKPFWRQAPDGSPPDAAAPAGDVLLI
ncbi:MAG: hypothetical protein JNK58_10560, partial [Phycisphaerae bacterium]|nr:hypothetical protein [Phycisphaerae bacterium]